MDAQVGVVVLQDVVLQEAPAGIKLLKDPLQMQKCLCHRPAREVEVEVD